jgi:hypothetical protein
MSAFIPDGRKWYPISRMKPSQILISIRRDLLLLINPKLSLFFTPETDCEIARKASLPPVTLSFTRSR